MLVKLRVRIIYWSTDFYIRTEFLTGDADNIRGCIIFEVLR